MVGVGLDLGWGRGWGWGWTVCGAQNGLRVRIKAGTGLGGHWGRGWGWGWALKLKLNGGRKLRPRTWLKVGLELWPMRSWGRAGVGQELCGNEAGIETGAAFELRLEPKPL